MKKTLTINLNRKVFHIDEDAYSLLDNYLQNLRNYFRKEQGLEEIMIDFEGRIEELLSEKIGKGIDVASISEIEDVIRQIGNPSDFGVESSDEKGNNQFFTTNQSQKNNTSGKKKFYCDPNNKIIGGVCSGIAAYSGWDVTWVRLATVLLFFLSFLIIDAIYMPGWFVILYITLWIVVPAARTAEQRLEMSGEPITVENIGKKVSEQANANNSNYERNNGCLNTFLKVCLIIFAITIGIPVLFVLVIIFIVLFAVLFGVGGIYGGFIPFFHNEFFIVHRPVLAAIGGFLFIAIPLISLIYTVVSAIFKWKPLYKSIKIITLVAWIISIFLLLFADWKVEWKMLRQWDKGSDTWVFEGTKLKGDGNIVKRTESFSETVKTLYIKGNLIIDMEIDSFSGDLPGLTIEGDSNIINNSLYIEQSGAKLLLNTNWAHGIKQTKPYKLLLKTSDLEKIEITGAVNLETVALNTDNLRVNATGASHIKMSDVNIADLKIDCTGISNATLQGNTRKVTLKATGISNIQANKLTADTVFADAAGTSKIKCNPIVFLDADATGISYITYNTEPESKSVSATGASKISVK